MKIYLVRHGQTEWNKRGKLQGQVNIALAPEGVWQAEKTAEGMKDIPFDIIFSSPLKRAYSTAEIIRAGREIPIIRDDRLKEMSFGIMEGRKFAKIKNSTTMTRAKRLFSDPAHYRAPKYGESFYDLIKRTDEFFKEQILPLEGEKETVLITAHGAVIRSVLVNLNHWPVGDFWKTPFGKNCSTALFECVNGEVKMIFENKLYY